MLCGRSSRDGTDDGMALEEIRQLGLGKDGNPEQPWLNGRWIGRRLTSPTTTVMGFRGFW